MKSKLLKNRVRVWFIVTLVILAAISAMVGQSFLQFKSQKGWVEHTYQAIGLSQDSISGIKDVQSAQRGYVITGQEDYLVPYSVAGPKIDSDLNKLRPMLADNPEQIKRYEVLKKQIQSRRDYAAKIIEAYREGGEKPAFALIRNGTGKREMDEIRSTVADMISEEEQLLAVR